MISFSTKSRTTRYKQFPFLRGFRCQISRNRKSWYFFTGLRLYMSSSLSLSSAIYVYTNTAFLCRVDCVDGYYRFLFLVFAKCVTCTASVSFAALLQTIEKHFWQTQNVCLCGVLLIGREFDVTHTHFVISSQCKRFVSFLQEPICELYKALKFSTKMYLFLDLFRWVPRTRLLSSYNIIFQAIFMLIGIMKYGKYLPIKCLKYV